MINSLIAIVRLKIIEILNMENIKKILGNPLIVLSARLILGMIFIMAAAGKIANPAVFAQEINNYDIMPYFTINIFALILPWIELICGLFLIGGIRLRASAAITGALLIVFIIAVASAMARGLNISCGCYSHIQEQPISWMKIFENLGQLALAGIVFFFPVKKFTFEELVLRNSEG